MTLFRNDYSQCCTIFLLNKFEKFEVRWQKLKKKRVNRQNYLDFVKWLSFDGLEIFIMTGKTGDNEITWFDAQNGEYTLEEVYNYWLENGKK